MSYCLYLILFTVLQIAEVVKTGCKIVIIAILACKAIRGTSWALGNWRHKRDQRRQPGASSASWWSHHVVAKRSLKMSSPFILILRVLLGTKCSPNCIKAKHVCPAWLAFLEAFLQPRQKLNEALLQQQYKTKKCLWHYMAYLRIASIWPKWFSSHV